MTATNFETDLDSDVLNLLDFDYSPPCDSPGGCDEPAAWKITMRCCGHIWLLCEKHKTKDLDTRNPKVVVRCNYCKEENRLYLLVKSCRKI